jgi:hypothetical protein
VCTSPPSSGWPRPSSDSAGREPDGGADRRCGELSRSVAEKRSQRETRCPYGDGKQMEVLQRIGMNRTHPCEESNRP